MNAKYLRIITILGLAFAIFGSATKVAADPPPDVLESYNISVSPQQDGTLAMNYTLQNYCTYSDWPGDQPYLQIGVPNRDFQINDWGPKDGKNKVVNAESVSGQFVQLDFDRGNLPKNGDCFNLNFSIIQSRMAYPDPGNGNVTFKFIPAGWNFPIQVKQLTVDWTLPADAALVKLTDPKPANQDSSKMTWQWVDPVMDGNGMFNGATVKLAYDKSAFTLPVEAAPVAPLASQPDSGNGGSDNGSAVFWTIIIIIAAVVVLILVIVWLSGGFDDDGGGGGSYTGGGGSYLGGGGFGSIGGGFGGSSGHSSGCVSMPSCACACACAGGGKVGCSRKGIGIKCLEETINGLTAEKKPETKDV